MFYRRGYRSVLIRACGVRLGTNMVISHNFDVRETRYFHLTYSTCKAGMRDCLRFGGNQHDIGLLRRRRIVVRVIVLLRQWAPLPAVLG